MERLRQRDINKLIDFLVEINVPANVEKFALTVMPALAKLVPGDYITYGRTDRRAGLTEWQAYPFDPSAGPEAFDRYQQENPAISYWTDTGHAVAIKTSDFVSARQYHDLGLYQEFFKPIEVEDTLGIMLASPMGVALGFASNRSVRNFTERERLLLDIIRPLLVESFLNAEALTLMDIAVASGTSGTALLDQELRVVHASKAALDLMREYLPRDGGALDDIPESLRAWIAAQASRLFAKDGFPHAPEPLRVQTRHGVLTVSIYFGHGSGEQSLISLREQLRPNPAHLRNRGLSNREVEILSLAIKGLSNAQIAEELTLSRRTVDRHFENVYNKLGVSNRSAALALAYGPQ